MQRQKQAIKKVRKKYQQQCTDHVINALNTPLYKLPLPIFEELIIAPLVDAHSLRALTCTSHFFSKSLQKSIDKKPLWQIIIGQEHSFFFNRKINELYGIFDNAYLEKILLRKQVRPDQVFAGARHSFILYEDKELYLMTNTDPLNNPNAKSAFKAQLIELPDAIIPLKMAIGYDHNVILTQDKQAFSFGKNNKGQLGFKNASTQETPKKISLPENKPCKDAAAGDFHTLLLCQDGSLFSFGHNRFGQLGLTHFATTFTPTFVNLPNQIEIKKIFARGTYSLILTKNHELYFSGKLIRQSHYPTLNQFTKLNLPPNIIIQFIYAGDEHIIIQSTNNKLFGYGNNQSGQLGLGQMKYCEQFQELKLPHDCIPETIMLDYDFTCIVSKNNKIFGFGNSRYQLDGKNKLLKLPERITFLEEIKDSHCEGLGLRPR